MKGLVDEATNDLTREGYIGASQEIVLSADTRYMGQDYALTIPVSGTTFTTELIEKLVEDFHQEHDKTYGYRSDKEEVQIVALRGLARGISATERVPAQIKLNAWKPDTGDIMAYFGPELGWIDVPVIGRTDLSTDARQGPMIIEEDNSLSVVTPGWKASLDDLSNIILESSDKG